jgi:Tfp pilus assembly protein PilF/4-amino-4-deoxy-L-arabinose transferase-like glycosyltransferase
MIHINWRDGNQTIMGRKKKKHSAKSSEKNQAGKTHSMDKDRLVKKVLKPEILLIGVFVLALFIRILYLNQIISTPIFQGLAVDDEKYESFALQILKGNLTHKDFIYLNPLYPFFLSLIYLIFGHGNLSVIFIQGIIDSISCVVIYYIASLLFNRKVGIISALIYACYGIAIFYTGILLAPTVVIFFTLLFIASLLFAEEKRQVIIFFISGILFGLVVLARPNVTLFLFLLPLWFFTVLKDKLGIHKSIQGILLLLVGFFMVTSLITIRNYSIEKRFSPFSVQGGINFYIGNNPEATGHFMSPHGISISPIEQVKNSIYYAEKESGNSLTPSQASRYWLFKGVQFIKDNFSDAFSLYMKKFALFWRKEEIPLNINYSLSKTFVPLFRLPLISFGIIAPFAILGIILFLKRKNNMLLILFILSYMVSIIIFFVSARYRLPIVPFLIICSSYALYRFVEMIRLKELKGITTFGALFILLFVGMNKNFACFKVIPTSHHNNLGKIYSKEGRLDKAVIELKKALLSDPYFVEAHCNLGITYLKKGLIKESIEEYKKALKVNPNYAEAHYNLGNAYVKKGRLDEAISEFKKTITINPNFAEARTNLGSIYAQKGRLDAAISEFKKTIAINPNFAEAHTNLGVAYYYKGNYKLAIVHCDKVVELGGRVNPKLLELLKPYR